MTDEEKTDLKNKDRWGILILLMSTMLLVGILYSLLAFVINLDQQIHDNKMEELELLKEIELIRQQNINVSPTIDIKEIQTNEDLYLKYLEQGYLSPKDYIKQ